MNKHELADWLLEEEGIDDPDVQILKGNQNVT